MSIKEHILPKSVLEGRKYMEDKPRTCDYCYWWDDKKRVCIRKEDCYYLLPEERTEPDLYQEGNCKTCGYGRYSPCIGYCIAKILKESREKKKAGD